MIENLSPFLELKFAPTAEGKFTGYGATFGNIDHVNDVIHKGAFSQAISDHVRAGTMPAMLWSHDPAQPVGVWERMEEDALGLVVEGRLTMGTAKGREAFALLRDNALKLSIGFTMMPEGARRRGTVREIIQIHRLHEISLVAMPANDQAIITSIKSAPDIARASRAFERFLRDAGGFSAKDAKTTVANSIHGLRGSRGTKARDELVAKVDALHGLVQKRVAQIERN